MRTKYRQHLTRSSSEIFKVNAVQADKQRSINTPLKDLSSLMSVIQKQIRIFKIRHSYYDS